MHSAADYAVKRCLRSVSPSVSLPVTRGRPILSSNVSTLLYWDVRDRITGASNGSKLARQVFTHNHFKSMCVCVTVCDQEWLINYAEELTTSVSTSRRDNVTSVLPRKDFTSSQIRDRSSSGKQFTYQTQFCIIDLYAVQRNLSICVHGLCESSCKLVGCRVCLL